MDYMFASTAQISLNTRFVVLERTGILFHYQDKSLPVSH